MAPQVFNILEAFNNADATSYKAVEGSPLEDELGNPVEDELGNPADRGDWGLFGINGQTGGRGQWELADWNNPFKASSIVPLRSLQSKAIAIVGQAEAGSAIMRGGYRSRLTVQAGDVLHLEVKCWKTTPAQNAADAPPSWLGFHIGDGGSSARNVNGRWITQLPEQTGDPATADDCVLATADYTCTADDAGKPVLVMLTNPRNGGTVYLDPRSFTATITRPFVLPSAPTNLRTTVNTHNQVELAWDAATPGTDALLEYIVYRDDQELGRVAQGTDPLRFADTVTATTTYHYAVTAVDTEDNESQPADLEVTTPAAPVVNQPPTAPTNLRSTAVALDAVALAWDPATDDTAVTGYTVYRDDVELGTTQPTVLTYTDATVQPATAYRYTVTATDAAAAESPASNALDVTTPAPPVANQPPTAPSNLHATSVGQELVELAWDPATDDTAVTGYRVYRDDQWLGGVDASLTEYTDNTVAPATAYRYTVTATDAAAAESDPSEPLHVVTPSTPLDQSWHTYRALTDVLAPRVANHIGLVNDSPQRTDAITMATQHIALVTEFVRGYTRNRGFRQGSPLPELAVVIVSATARLVANPEQVSYYQTGDYTERPALLDGFTLPEQAILHRHRRIRA